MIQSLSNEVDTLELKNYNLRSHVDRPSDSKQPAQGKGSEEKFEDD